MSRHHSSLLIFALAVWLPGIPVCKAAEPMALVLERYGSQLCSQPAPPAATIRKYVESISKDGTWPDVNYADRSMAAWLPLTHVMRIREMALALKLEKKPQANPADIHRSLGLALDHWCAKRYRSPNWFFNDISVPRAMRDIVLLLGNDLTGARRRGTIEVMGQYKLGGTGANLMWSAELALHHGCITGNAQQVAEAARRMWAEVLVGGREGIQRDGSFYQHGPRLQTFHYGAGYLGVVCNFAWQLRQTPWAIPEAKSKIISNYILDGPQWMCRGVETVPGTLDRAVSRKGSMRGASLAGPLALWKEVAPERTQEFNALIARQAGRGEALSGYRHFPQGDFTVYHRPAASFFLKTISDRTNYTESINSENLKGVPFLNCGDHYILRDGTEYHDLPPLWQWNHLPGLTMAPEDLKQKRTPFVGGIGNGQSGLTAMDYARENADGVSLTLRKSWFSHGDLIICLLGGMETVKIPGPVVSSMEQCKLQGPVTVRENLSSAKDLKPGDHQFTNVRWILHNQIGYIPPPNMAGVKVSIATREGDWHALANQFSTEKTKGDVLQILAVHKPGKESQGWAILLGATAKDLDALTLSPPWRILNNDRTCQSIQFSDGLRMAAFFEPGANSKEPELTVEKPCLAIWSKSGLWLGDPTQKGGQVPLTWLKRSYSPNLPGGGKVTQLAATDAKP
jgi:chondroitin AC lyase